MTNDEELLLFWTCFSCLVCGIIYGVLFAWSWS